MSGFSSAPLPCEFFKRGNCKSGSNCRFSHFSSSPAPAASPAAPYIPPKVCSFFLKGQCANGANCRFLHPSSASSAQPQAPAARKNASPASSAEPRICSFFQQGRCTNGDSCKFLHPASLNPPPPSPNSASDAGKKPGSAPAQSAAAALVEQDAEPRPYSTVEGPFYSIDVECVATGTGHLARAVGHVVLVDSEGNPILDEFVKPDVPVHDYLEQLTGLRSENLQSARSLSEVVATLKSLLPSSAVLVGQGIKHDVDWLSLQQGVDFREIVDIAEMFRLRKPRRESDPPQYRHFSLRHTCVVLLGEDMQTSVHSPLTDARYSLRLFHTYRKADVGYLRALRSSIARAPPTKSFAQKWHFINGVALGKDSYRAKDAARFLWRWFVEKSKAKKGTAGRGK